MTSAIRKIELLMCVFLVAVPQSLKAQTGASPTEITLQRFQPLVGRTRQPTVIEQWVFRMRSSGEQCDVQVMRGNTVSSSHSYGGSDCTRIVTLANDADRTNFADALDEHQITDRQYFRIRLGAQGGWHEVSKVAPKIGTITDEGILRYDDQHQSAPQALLWNIQLLGSGRR